MNAAAFVKSEPRLSEMDEQEKLRTRINEITGWTRSGRVNIITDTSDWLRITRGCVVRLGDRDYIIKGNEYERRFGIQDQPKYWVFSAFDMETAQKKIIKTVFHEEFHVHIGIFKIHCYRSPEKEAKVLDLVRGDDRFMQGFAVLDDKKNHVRIVDFIPGQTIFNYIFNIPKEHEEYFHGDLPGILWKLTDSIEAIKLLHDNKTCHGDIRNDHIIIDANTGKYRWIDFDLNQHVADFDLWSVGNIVNYAAGKGITAFNNVLKSSKFSDEVKNSLKPEDASGFFEYRLMNLAKLYPYIPKRLTDILLHFTIKPKKGYTHIDEFLDDFREMLVKDFPSGEKQYHKTDSSTPDLW